MFMGKLKVSRTYNSKPNLTCLHNSEGFTIVCDMYWNKHIILTYSDFHTFRGDE